jgi:hypothetical protein
VPQEWTGDMLFDDRVVLFASVTFYALVVALLRARRRARTHGCA